MRLYFKHTILFLYYVTSCNYESETVSIRAYGEGTDPLHRVAPYDCTTILALCKRVTCSTAPTRGKVGPNCELNLVGDTCMLLVVRSIAMYGLPISARRRFTQLRNYFSIV